MSVVPSQTTVVSSVYPTVCLGVDQKTWTLRFTGLWEGNSLVTSEFPAQMASNVENVSIWWRYHIIYSRCSLRFGGISQVHLKNVGG